MTDKEERAYIEGARRANLSTLQHVLGELRSHGADLEADKAAWVLERQDIVAKLRFLCEEYGDNEWDDDLHLRDVIEKHLEPYLSEKLPRN